MSEAKFTKGEWKVRLNCVGVVDDSDTQSYGSMLAVCHIDKYDFINDWESNAHLIAAAPEMYEMLKRIYDTYELKFYDNEKIENILAKATGEKCEK